MLTIHMNKNFTRLAIVSNASEVIAKVHNDTPATDIRSLTEQITQFLDTDKNLTFASIGIALDAAIGGFNEGISKPTPFTELVDFDVQQFMYQKYGVSTLLLKESHAEAEYLLNKHKLQELSSTVVVTVGESIEASIFLDNKLLLGANKQAGSLGHLHAMGNKVMCECGKKGCMNLHASETFLKRLSEHLIGNSSKDAIFTNNKAFDLVTHYFEGLASAIAPTLSLIDPECLVLNGDVFMYKGFPMERLISLVEDYSTVGARRIQIGDTEPFKACMGLMYHKNSLNKQLKQVCHED